MDLDIKEIIFVICFLSLMSSAYESDDFVNPSDILNFDPVNMRMKNKVQEKENSLNKNGENYLNKNSLNKLPPVSEESTYQDDGKKSLPSTEIHNQCNCKKDKDLALKPIFKRYIMSLVRHIENQIEEENNPAEFCLKMKASQKDLLTLEYYGTGVTDDVHTVYEKLDKMLLYSMELPDEGGTVFWLERKLGLSSPVLIQIIAVFSLVLVAAKMLVRIQITRSFIGKAIVFTFLISTITTFFELYQKKIANQEKILTQEITDRCPHLRESAFSRLTGYLSSSVTFQDENCKEYYEAVVVHPFFQVSILEAISISLVKTLVAPMNIIGHGVKDFLVGLHKDLPLQHSMYISTIMVILFLTVPFLAFGYTLKVPFLFSLQPPPKPQIQASHEDKRVKDPKCLCTKDNVPQLQDSTPSSIYADISFVAITDKTPTSYLENQPAGSSDKVEARLIDGNPKESDTVAHQINEPKIQAVVSPDNQPISQQKERENLQHNRENESVKKDELSPDLVQDRVCGDEDLLSNSDIFFTKENITLDKTDANEHMLVDRSG